MTKPLSIDLFCGLGGWTDGLIAENYSVIGFDIERHEYLMPDVDDATANGVKGTKPVERRGWTQGCAISLGMEGASMRPRTKLAKYPAQLVLQDVLTLHGSQFRDASLIVASPPCQEYSYMAMPWSRGKQIARALRGEDEFPANYRGSRTLEQLTALFDACFRIQREAIEAAGHFIPLIVENVKGAQPWVGSARGAYGSFLLWGDVPALMPMAATRRMKFPADCGPRKWADREYVKLNDGNASAFHHEGATNRNPVHALTNQAEGDGVKSSQSGAAWFDGTPRDKMLGEKGPAAFGSKSSARKAASAAIAKIPLVLARHIAKCWFPLQE